MAWTFVEVPGKSSLINITETSTNYLIKLTEVSMMGWNASTNMMKFTLTNDAVYCAITDPVEFYESFAKYAGV